MSQFHIKAQTAILLLLLSACQPGNRSVSEIVDTENGKIEGYVIPEKGLHVFKGIPFAKPPVGELRWKAPQPVENWEGIKQCKEFSAIAMQGDPQPFWMWTGEFIAPAGNMSEDCLYLNVWTPAKTSADKLPVMVFIHGGGFTTGSGSVPIYDGESMAQKGIVFVTINYRVGIFGFFSHPELSAQSPEHASGNQGLLDQVAALKWINHNIEAFGGDPGNVTITGQSAGAFSVSYLSASPLCKGLFHQVIAESGGATLPAGRLSDKISLDQAEKTGLQYQEEQGVNSLSELRNIDAEVFLKQFFNARPVIDGYFLPEAVYEIYLAGEQNDVPLISGWNEDEGLGGPAQNAEKFIASLRERHGESAGEFMDLFPAGTDEEAAASKSKLNTLTIFGIQTYNWMMLQNETGKSDVYVYYFTRDVPFGEGQQDFGAFHSGELGYAYDNLGKNTVRPWTETDRMLAEQMSAYWVNFAKTGNPNGADLPPWKACKPGAYQTIYFGKDIKVDTIPDLNRLQFLRKYYSFTEKAE